MEVADTSPGFILILSKKSNHHYVLRGIQIERDYIFFPHWYFSAIVSTQWVALIMKAPCWNYIRMDYKPMCMKAFNSWGEEKKKNQNTTTHKTERKQTNT